MTDRLYLTNLSCSCALGRTNEEILANVRARTSAGMVSLPDDVPGRPILFGMVPGGLPQIDEPEFDMRANRLLLLAVQNLRAKLEAFVARHGAHRVAVVLGASNTGIDEAQRHVDRWLDEGAKPPEMFF